MWGGKGHPFAEEWIENQWWERGKKPYGNSQTRSCIETTNFLLLGEGSEIHCSGSRKQQWMELIIEDLIKERAVDDIHPLGNKINNCINWIFANSWQWRERLCRLDLRLLTKGPCTRFRDNKIFTHLFCFDKQR